MNKNKLSILVAVLLANMLFVTEVIACRGYKIAPGYKLAKKYKLKLIIDNGGGIWEYKMNVYNRLSGKFYASVQRLFSPINLKENITITQNGDQLSFDIPLDTKIIVQPNERTQIVYYMCDSTLNPNCSIDGRCIASYFLPEINQQVNLQATVLAQPKNK